MKIVIWGYKTFNHTHHSIHFSFYKGFKSLGYETYHFDNDDDVSGFNFNDCLFLTEGQVDQKIPHNVNSKYILHNCNVNNYQDILSKNKINIQCYYSDVTKYDLNKINQYTYIGSDTIYQPWATDLLPDEINESDACNEMNNRECVWVGSYNPADHTIFQNNTELDPFFNECKKHNISIKHVDPWLSPVSMEENKRLVNNAYVAPAINGIYQKKNHYVPCRIFKNISYGHLGITNNEFVNSIFDNKLIYYSDTAELFRKTVEKKYDPKCLEEIKFLMNEVKNKHTYINRIKIILEVLGVV